MAHRYLFEVEDGACYGYFWERYLYTLEGKCTHLERGSYLCTIEAGHREFYREGKYYYTVTGNQCRWFESQQAPRVKKWGTRS